MNVYAAPGLDRVLPDWSKPVNGIITVPDELDSLVNNIGMQIKFHTISGKGEIETVCRIAYLAQQFFYKLYKTPIDERYKKLSIQDVARIVSEITGVSISQMQSGIRKREIVTAKHICYYFLRKRTNHTLNDAAAFFSDHHSTGIHAIAKITGYLEIKDKYTNELLTRIEERI